MKKLIHLIIYNQITTSFIFIFILLINSEIYEFEIDNNETFGTLRRKAAEVMKIPKNDLLLVGKLEYSREFDSKKLSEIEGLDDDITLFAVFVVSSVDNIIWTIYVQNYSDSEIYEFEIDNNETFGTLRRKVAEEMKISFNDLILVVKLEYSKKFDSKILSEIEGLDDGITLFAVFKVGAI